MHRKLNWHICWQMGKTSPKAKIPPGDFKVTTLKNPLINNQEGILPTTLAYPKIPTYNWTFSLIPNWTWSCSSFLSLDAQISNLWLCTDLNMWLTPTTWTNVVGCKVLHFINNEDLEVFGYKTLWRINTVDSHRENKSLGLCICVWQPLK